jgi:Spy/CpxP family protein refolding chaperone
MNRFVNAAIFLFAIGSLAFAQPGPPGPPPPMAKGDPLVSYLALTAEQKTQWQTARQSFDDGIKPLRDHIDATHQQLEQLMDAKSTDAAAIGNLMIDIRNTHDQIKAKHDALDTTLEGFLTAGQKVKFEAFRAAQPPMPHPPMDRPPHPPRP